MSEKSTKHGGAGCCGGASAGVSAGADAGADAGATGVNAAAGATANVAASAATSVAGALERLRAAGLRLTKPRRAMLRALADAGAPVSVEEVHRALAGAADLVTVYRGMEDFARVGVVRRHPLESGKNLWALEAAGGAHHHHVICRECGHADELDGCEAAKFESAARRLGYRDVSHVFEIYGVCPSCASKEHDRR
ncbi:MAG: transcriptional repressor [Puniceicoccales bacterium]|nr:transcriptional repressor [Puniceicoccales bacterium]